MKFFFLLSLLRNDRCNREEIIKKIFCLFVFLSYPESIFDPSKRFTCWKERALCQNKRENDLFLFFFTFSFPLNSSSIIRLHWERNFFLSFSLSDFSQKKRNIIDKVLSFCLVWAFRRRFRFSFLIEIERREKSTTFEEESKFRKKKQTH